MKLPSKIVTGLAALVLAGTFFTSTAYSTIHHYPAQQRTSQIEKVSSKKLAVLLIDMHDSFLKEVAEEEKEKEIPYQLDVLDYCKDNNIPVIVLEYELYGETIRVLKKKVDSLPVKEYITKSYDDGFFKLKPNIKPFQSYGRPTKLHDDDFLKTELEDKLRAYGVDSILLMGINASGCVLKTAESAVKLGFKIITSKDLIADPDWHVSGPLLVTKEGKKGTSDNSAPWYKEHGIYRDNYKELFELIRKE